jgi:hypothetical protein
MAAIWTVRNGSGEILENFVAESRLEVGRKVVPTRFDAFRFHVSSSYRENFERALTHILDVKCWEIVRVK